MRRAWILSFLAVILVLGVLWSGTVRMDATPSGDGARIMPFIHLVDGMEGFSFWDPYRNGGYPILANPEHFFLLSLLVDPSSPYANLSLNLALYIGLLSVGVVAWAVAKKSGLSPFWAAVAAISIGFSEVLLVIEQSARFQGITMLLVILLVHGVMGQGKKGMVRLLLLSCLTAVALVSSAYYALLVTLIILSFSLFPNDGQRKKNNLRHLVEALFFTCCVGIFGLLLSAPFTYPLLHHATKSFVSLATLTYRPDLVHNLANIVIPSVSADRVFVGSLIVLAISLIVVREKTDHLTGYMSSHTLPVAALIVFSLMSLPVVGEYIVFLYAKIPVVSGLRHHNAYIFFALPSLIFVSCRVLQEYESECLSNINKLSLIFISVFCVLYAFMVLSVSGQLFFDEENIFLLFSTFIVLLLSFLCVVSVFFQFKFFNFLNVRCVAILFFGAGILLLIPQAFAERNPWDKRILHVTNDPSDALFYEKIHADNTPFFRVYREYGVGRAFDVLQSSVRGDGFSYFFPKGWAYSLSLLSAQHDLTALRPHWVRNVPCKKVSKSALAFLGVKYMICNERKLPKSLPGWRKAAHQDGYVLLESVAFEEPIRLYSNWKVMGIRPPHKSRRAILFAFKKGEVLIDHLPDGFSGLDAGPHLDGGDESRVDIVRADPGSFELSVSSSKSAILVIPENWDEGWRLTVNGETKKTVRAFMAYLGVPIQSGTSTVMLEYRDNSFIVGMLVSLSTLLVLGGTCLFSRLMRGRPSLDISTRSAR